jgi:hypothetical protein
MKLFGFRPRRPKARPSNEEPPKTDGSAETLRRSTLAVLDLDLTRERRWDDFFKNGPRVSDDFMQEREQPPAEEREPF